MVQLKKNSWPLQSQCKAKFGVPTYTGKFKNNNMVQVTLPFPMDMDGIVIKKVWVNKICAESLIRILTYLWEDVYGKDMKKVKAAGINIFSGTWAIRSMRTGPSMSMHAYGLAIDINAPNNGLGEKPGHDVFSFEAHDPIVKAFEAEGWVWGGRWKRPDGMHFQAAIVG